MTAFCLDITTRAPLVIAARHVAQGGATPSLDHVPGTVLRGALAAAFLRMGHAPSSPLFQTLFAGDHVRYGNLYPTVPEAVGATWPLPATAWSCKVQPGFLPDDPALALPEDPHGVTDTLTRQLDDTISQGHDRCAHAECGSALEPRRGYCARTQAGRYLQPEHTRRLITRTAIAGKWGTPRDGRLYTVEAIEEDQKFVGYIHTDGTADAELNQALQDVRDAHSLHLGLGRSRGLGQVDLSFRPEQGHLGIRQPLSARWQTPALGARLRNLPPDRFAFSITLYSDAILLDDYARYQAALNDDALARVIRYAAQPPGPLPARPTSIHYCQGVTSIESVHNWRFAPGWRKRTAEELAVTRGSVFVFDALQSEQGAVLALLNRLEENGIGRRRTEGFGQIIVGHPWHNGEDLR